MNRFTFAVLTVSDRSSRGERTDKSAPEIEALLAPMGGEKTDYAVVPDEIPEIRDMLIQWSDREDPVDLIVTTGGTGLHPRDVTPEATRECLHREIPGMPEAMRAESLKKTPHAMLSRALAGVRGRTLIINLPGSPKGARENLQAVLGAIRHAMEKAQGDPSECGTP